MSLASRKQFQFLRSQGFKRLRHYNGGRLYNVVYKLGPCWLLKRGKQWEAALDPSLNLTEVMNPLFPDTTAAILYAKVEGWV